MTLEEIIARSGDSKLLGYTFASGLLEIQLEHDELDQILTLRIPTDFVYGGTLSKDDDIFLNCRIELIRLADVLTVENGFYVPKSDFGGFMWEVKNGVSLAYGRKAPEFKYLLSAIGYTRLISCLIPDLASVEWILSKYEF